MRKSIVTLAVAGVVAVSGAALAGPALAEGVTPSASSSSSTDGSATDRGSPQERIARALSGLVTDGTITQAQSEEVAATLADALPQGGHDGPRGIGIGQITAAAAKALGVSEADLRAELDDGRSVADVAQDRGVDLDTVITAVTDAVTARIAQGVEDGSITQARAEELTATLEDRVTEEVDEVHDGSHRGGPGGRGGPSDGPDDPAASATPAPAAPAS